MNAFNRLPGFVQTPAGRERDVLRLLPRVLVFGTLLLALPSLGARIFFGEVDGIGARLNGLAERRRTMVRLLVVALAAMACPLLARADQPPLPLGELAKPGRLLMLRHAHAPGFGDPPNFVIGDCSTQRNLDASGRAQARELGARLRAVGLTNARVFASQWCRARETARLLNLGPVESLPALNSFFERQGDRQRILDDLRAFLAKLPVDGQPVILVTHQVVVNAFTEATPPAGGGSIFQINGTGAPQWIGTIPIEAR